MNNDKTSAFYTYLSSQQTVQQFLLQVYKKQGWDDPESLSYKNSLSFLYYLEHGKTFYETGQKMSIEIKPILLFYGMSHLIKALLLARRPYYPESTKMLSHGVSTRKRKKKDYTFLEDEVKKQQFGLFPYFAEHLCGIDYFPVEKFKMIHLLSIIPEMNELFLFEGEQPLCEVGEINCDTIVFPSHILDSYHLTANAFIKRINKYLPNIKDQSVTGHTINIKLEQPLHKVVAPFYVHENNKVYFPISRAYSFPLSELMVHYLLLYNLSMVSRYETEWWGDLVNSKADKDFSFISHFLQITSKKIPLLIGQDLANLY